jgi:hypothetical protein
LQRNNWTLEDDVKDLFIHVSQQCQSELANNYRRLNDSSSPQSIATSEHAVGLQQDSHVPQQSPDVEPPKLDQWNVSPTEVVSVSGRENSPISGVHTYGAPDDFVPLPLDPMALPTTPDFAFTFNLDGIPEEQLPQPPVPVTHPETPEFSFNSVTEGAPDAPRPFPFSPMALPEALDFFDKPPEPFYADENLDLAFIPLFPFS